MADRCLGRNRDGSPCSAQPRGDGYCLWHSPSMATERASWRKRGGEQRSNRARAKKSLADAALTPHDLEGVLGMTLKAVLAGKVQPGVGNCVRTSPAR